MNKNILRSCLICNHKAKLFCQSGGRQIYKCINCGFGITEDLKTQKGGYHRDEDYIADEKLFKNIFQKRVNIISKLINQGKVIEVGCSTGLMLGLLKEKGWEVKGVEISKKAAQTAIARGLELYTIPFEKINITEKFDLVIFNHTLEHLKDPISIIRKAKMLLNPKGFIYIDLPNFGSLSVKLFKSKWSHLLPEEHLWHFTKKSFLIIFEELDLKMIYIERASGIWDYDRPALELWQALKGLKKRFFSDFITAIPALIISKLSLGTDLMVIAKKND